MTSISFVIDVIDPAVDDVVLFSGISGGDRHAACIRIRVHRHRLGLRETAGDARVCVRQVAARQGIYRCVLGRAPRQAFSRST
jgi:hypothetical protein